MRPSHREEKLINRIGIRNEQFEGVNVVRLGPTGCAFGGLGVICSLTCQTGARRCYATTTTLGVWSVQADRPELSAVEAKLISVRFLDCWCTVGWLLRPGQYGPIDLASGGVVVLPTCLRAQPYTTCFDLLSSSESCQREQLPAKELPHRRRHRWLKLRRRGIRMRRAISSSWERTGVGNLLGIGARCCCGETLGFRALQEVRSIWFL